MKLVQALGFLLSILCFHVAAKCPDVCVLHDPRCVTSGGHYTYSKVVAGVDGLIPPLDPLHLRNIYGNYGFIRFDIFNIILKGLKQCQVTNLSLNVTTSEYIHQMDCPKLITSFTYETSEKYLHKFHKKRVEKTIGRYDITNEGLYGVLVTANDHQPHFFIQTETLKTTSRLQGKLKIYVSDHHHHHSDKSREECVKKHWTVPEEILTSHVIKRAMKILIDNVDIYIRANEMGEVLSSRNNDCDDDETSD